MSVKARVVVLAAGTLESTRLLLNSKLANSSGLVGRYLMDQIYGAGVVCSVPEARRNGNRNGVMGSSSIVPRFRNIETKSDKFLRGYAFNTTAATGAVAARNFRGVWCGAATQDGRVLRQWISHDDHGRGAGTVRESCAD